MAVLVAFGSTARAACLACLRASVPSGAVRRPLLQRRQQFGVGARRTAAAAAAKISCSAGSAAITAGSTTSGPPGGR